VDEKELTLSFQRGEGDAYRVIFDRYYERVRNVCRRMLANPDDAAEACQETFLRVYQALGRFNGRYELGAWITRIATNVCLDELRSRGRRPNGSAPLETLDWDGPELDHEASPEGLAVRRSEGDRVVRTLDSLPPLHRAAMVLREFEGLSYEEIAIALGMTASQVKALLHRARRNFKRSWISALGFLLPTRWLQRLRGIENSSVEHVAQGGLSNVQVITSCSTIVHQCGQFVAERVAPIVTAVAVAGVASMGAATSGRGDEAAASSAKETSVQATATRALTELLIEDKKTEDHKQEKETKKVSSETDAPTAPAAEPTSSPTPTTTPTPAPPPGGSEQSAPGAGQAPPVLQPAPSPTPRTVTSYLGFNRGQSVPKGTVKTNTASVNCDGSSVSQQMETTLADGSSAYPTSFQANAGSSSVSLSLTVWPRGSSGGNVQYDATGTLIQENRNSDDQMTLRYSGTYTNRDAPDAEQAGLPDSGGFVLDFALDCRTSAVVSVGLLLEAE
jgi:RNA polymerase sigma-70 factor (ECF subfamily)